uniref:Uncharacterized protein n=1 Tax=viral metagenome TaxID=1070528 RepID=A0A6C0BI80_9ZZZZ
MEPQKVFFYPRGDFNSIPEKWLKDDDLRVKLAQMERLKTNPNWAIVNSENNIANMKYTLERNIKELIQRKRSLGKRQSSLCGKITRGARRWLPCGSYSEVDHNERKTRKIRKNRKQKKQMKN